MSKKQFDNRLNSLFDGIDELITPTTPVAEKIETGWTWECNSSGQYLACSADVAKILGIPAESFLGESLTSFCLASESITALQHILDEGNLPGEVDLYYQSRQGILVPIHMHVFNRVDANGTFTGWRGFTQVLSYTTLTPTPKETPVAPSETHQLQSDFLQKLRGISSGPDGIQTAAKPWTPTAIKSILTNKPVFQPGDADASAALAIPFNVQGKTAGILEILDETNHRRWSEDDRLLIQEVASQLGLALENAQLFASAQQELSERVRAEEETLRRNRDLATLNQIGQQLNRLASPSKIFELVSTAIGQVMDNSNLFIAEYDENSQRITFPIYMMDGQPQIVSGQPFENGFIEYIIKQRVPLLIPNLVKSGFASHGLEPLSHMPTSLLGVPMVTGEKVIGVVVVQSFTQENAFTSIHADLLSTIASQAAIALENASLFQQMQGALITIEVRERYQKNVAKAVAALNESGTQALSDVLKMLGEAAQTSRVYYAQVRQLGHEAYWQVTNEWCNEGSPSLLDNWQKVKIPTVECTFLASELEQQGRIAGVRGIMPPAEERLLQSWGVRSFLAIAVAGKHKVPSFIGFDEINYERPWGTEEIDALQMAASALSNTIIREDLMDQLQVSLDESESLYNTSRRLAMASSLQEMVSALTEGLRISDINRAQVMLFDNDPSGQVDSLRVAANWYSGWGTQPAAVNTGYDKATYAGFNKILSPIPLFIDDLRSENQLLNSKQSIVDLSKTTSAAIIPLWVGKHQLGVFLILAEVKHTFIDREMRSYPPLVGQLAIAIENLRLFEQTQSALSETEELYQASADLNTAKTYEDILTILQKYTVLGQGAHNISLSLFDLGSDGEETPESIVIVALKSLLPAANISEEYLQQAFLSALHLLNPSAPTIIKDDPSSHLQDDQLSSLFLNRIIARSTIFVPVVVGGRWIGFINAIYQESNSFPDNEIRQVMGLVGQAAVAIQNIQSINAAENRAEEATLLFQTSRRLAQARMETELYQIALEACKRGVDVNSLFIFLLDNTSGGVRLRQVAHLADADLPQIEDAMGYLHQDSSIEDPLFSGQTIISARVDMDERFSFEARQYFIDAKVIGVMVLPLQLRGVIMGVIVAGRKHPQSFTATETTFIQTVATQLSVAIDNSHLLEETQRSAAQARQRSQELAVINRVVSSVAASTDLRTGLQTVIDEVCTSLPLFSGGISLLDKERNLLTLIAVHSDADAPSQPGLQMPLAAMPPYQQAIATRQTIIIDYENIDSSTMESSFHQLMKLRHIRALLILPLTVGSEVIGVINMEISEGARLLTSDEIRLAETIVFQAASAIQNTRLLEQIQDVLSETELLYNISRSVAQASSPQDLLGLVVEFTLPKAADRVSLFSINFDNEGLPFDLEVLGFHDIQGQYQSLGIHLPVSSLPVINKVTSDPLMITDIHSGEVDPVSRDTLEQFNIVSSCLVPLRSSGRTIGYLVASSQKPASYQLQEMRLLQTTGDGIAVALEKQRLLQEAQRRALELQTAAEIARDTSSTLALDTLLTRCVTSINDRFGYQNTAIFLLDERNEYAVIQAATGAAGDAMINAAYKFTVDEKSVVGTAAQKAETIIINDVKASPIFTPEPLLPDTQAEMAVPLRIGTRVLGVLDVQSSQVNAFNSDDVAVLQTLSDQITVAIENARSFEFIEKAMVELREVDRVKSQFLANMSHELRTPLNSIIGFSRVILKGIDGPISEVQQVDLTAIYNSGQHLLRLINDILDSSKIEAGKMELSNEDVNLIDQINTVMSTAVGFTKDKPIRLVRHVPAQLPIIRGDPTRIRQALLNLLSNAAKFTENGDVVLDVEEQLGPDNQPEIIFKVTDTGPGIVLEDQAKLFQPFSQVDDSPTRKSGGTGLGLSISRSLIEMHGGRIGLLWSEVGKGSTFYFTLPCPPAKKPEGTVGGDQNNVVLAIDDDAQVIGLYDRYLSSQGYQVVPLTDPRSAIETARKVKPFVITLDILMPHLDGWQVLNELKHNPETKDIPVIICSILAESDKGISMGALDYLVKPVLADDLIRIFTRIKLSLQTPNTLITKE